MLILGVDSTGKSASCALVKDGSAVGERFTVSGYTHSETLVPMIKTLLTDMQVEIGDIDAIAVTIGPGSFTGIRIGLSTVKGIAFAHNTPCIPVSTLECLAYAARDFGGTVCPVLDARRGQVYNALFSRGIRLTDDRAIAASELASLTGNVLLTGDGVEVCREFLPEAKIAPEAIRLTRAVFAAMCADTEKAAPPSELRPSYLRLSQAEREKIAKEMLS